LPPNKPLKKGAKAPKLLREGSAIFSILGKAVEDEKHNAEADVEVKLDAKSFTTRAENVSKSVNVLLGTRRSKESPSTSPRTIA
jgi:hypothetical protein